jgi:adenylate cyclase
MHLWRRFTMMLGALSAFKVTWGLALVFCVWAVLDAMVLKVATGLGNSTYDAMLRARVVAAAPDPRVVIVDIDEASLARMAPEFGRWPWPRDTLATVLDYVEKQQPQAVVWDVVFSDADRLSPGGDKAFDEAAKRSTKSHFAVVRLPQPYDAQSQITRKVLPGLWLPVVTGTGTDKVLSSSTVAVIPPVLPAVAAGKLGYNNGYSDPDGVLRRYRLQETLPDGGQLQSLALSVALQVNAPVNPLTTSTIKKIANYPISTSEKNQFFFQNTDSLMVWRARANSYPRIAFADVFAVAEGGIPNAPVPSLAGKIVLIGSTASSLHDIHPTPLGAQHAGVDSLATAIDNAVNQRHMAELPRWLQALIATLLCIGMAWWVQRNGISSLDAALLLLPGALLGISYLSLNGSPVFIDLHLAAGVALLFIALLRLWNGWRRNYWCSPPSGHATKLGSMALRMDRPVADIGLDALIRAIEAHAPQCRIVGGDATATWPAQLRWPELLHTAVVAGPLTQLGTLRAALLARTTPHKKRPALLGLNITTCTQPVAVPGSESDSESLTREDWAAQALAAHGSLPVAMPVALPDTAPSTGAAGQAS